MPDPLFTAFNMLGEIPDRLEQVVSRAVRATAFQIQRAAAKNAPVDTGFLKSSLYVQTQKSSTYGTAAKQPPKGAELLPEEPAPTKATQAQVVAGASYAPFVEFGTVHGPAQPFLGPAAEAISPKLKAVLSNLEPGLMNPLSIDDGSADGGDS